MNTKRFVCCICQVLVYRSRDRRESDLMYCKCTGGKVLYINEMVLLWSHTYIIHMLFSCLNPGSQGGSYYCKHGKPVDAVDIIKRTPAKLYSYSIHQGTKVSFPTHKSQLIRNFSRLKKPKRNER